MPVSGNDNLIRNPEFEKVDQEDTALGWEESVTTDTHVYYTGSRAAKSTRPVRQQVEVLPDTGYRLTVYAFQPSSNHGVTLRVWDKKLDNAVAVSRNNTVTVGSLYWGPLSRWTKLELAFRTPENMNKVVIEASASDNTQFWLDQCRLERDDSVRHGKVRRNKFDPDDLLHEDFDILERNWFVRYWQDIGKNIKTDKQLEKLEFEAVRGETVPAVFAVRAARDLENLNLSLQNVPANTNGEQLSREAFDLLKVRSGKREFSNRRWAEIPLFLPKAQDLDLERGGEQLYWIDVALPPNQPAGRYEGQLELTASNGASRSVPIEVKVHDFSLLEPDIHWGMYIHDPHYNKAADYRRYLKDMHAHGMSNVIQWGGMPFEHEKLRHLKQEAGLPRIDLPGVTNAQGNRHPRGGERAYKLLKDYRRRGQPKPYFYLWDEPGNIRQIQAVKARARTEYAHPDIHTITAGGSFELARIYDAWIRYVSDLFTDSHQLNKAKKWGREVHIYEYTLRGANPQVDRYLGGIAAWKLGLNGVWNWGYTDKRTGHVDEEGRWHDTDPHRRGYVIPSPEGPIATVGWKARRAGTNDYRYLYTLEQYLDIAASVELEEENKTIVEEAKTFLEQIRSQVKPGKAFEDWPSPNIMRQVDFNPQSELDHQFYEKLRSETIKHIEALRKLGIAPKEETDSERSPFVKSGRDSGLHDAAKTGDTEALLEVLANGVDIEQRCETWQWPALHYASEEGHLEAVNLLLEKGASLEKSDRMGWTALHVAAEAGNADVAAVLIEAGAVIDAMDKDGRSPLTLAAFTGAVDSLARLVEAGADVNLSDNEGRTPLHWSGIGSKPDVAEILLKHGADHEVQDEDGFTPLHWAARNCQPEIVRLLLGAGADPNVQEQVFGWTPLHWLAYMWEPELSSSIVGNSTLGKARKTMDVLFENAEFVNPDARDNNGNTALHLWAGWNGCHKDPMEFILKRGADPDLTNSKERTALHAVSTEKEALVLLEYGASINRRDKDGNTPLHRAASNGLVEVVKTLTKEGADIERENFQQQTARELADPGKAQGKTKVKLVEISDILNQKKD
ncbi:MAG: ankyrin repeat domain-containing protein [Verrucomicrobiota bacterium]